MRIHLMLFGVPPGDYAPVAERAEALGFTGLWLPDHLVTPTRFEKVYPYSASGDPGYTPDTPLADVWVTIGHLAARTRTLQLGTGVFLLALRNPFVAARAAATAQDLSGGRVVMGVGTGWMGEEYAAVGERFQGRGSRTDEMLDVLTRLWTGLEVSHTERWYRFGPVVLAPAPCAPIPIVGGGATEPALARAARHSGWYGPACALEESVRCRDRVEELRRELGRGRLPFRYYVRLLEPRADAARGHEDAGFEDLVLGVPRGTDLAGRLRAVEAMARQLLR